MWVLHEPGTCTSNSRGSANTAQGRGGRGRGGGRDQGNGGGRGNGADRKAKLAQVLEKHTPALGNNYNLLVEQLNDLDL